MIWKEGVKKNKGGALHSRQQEEEIDVLFFASIYLYIEIDR